MVDRITRSLNFSLFLPKFWLLWIGLICIWLVTLLPYRLQMTLGAKFGLLMFYIMPWRRRIAEINIAACFPDHSPAEQHSLVKACFCSAGMAVPETALSWWGKKSRLKKLVEINGLHHLTKALEKGRGVILLGAHFTCLEMSGRLLSMHQPVCVMYKKHRNPVLETFTKHYRDCHFKAVIQRHDVRALVRTLKQNMPIWYAPDQDYKHENIVFVPFMGIQAATLVATSKLAKLMNSPVVPFFPVRRHNGKGYYLQILPPVENFPTGDEKFDATTINQIIESQIKKTPEQYLWLHRRFKTRPPGEKEFYPSRRK